MKKVAFSVLCVLALVVLLTAQPSRATSCDHGVGALQQFGYSQGLGLGVGVGCDPRLAAGLYSPLRFGVSPFVGYGAQFRLGLGAGYGVAPFRGVAPLQFRSRVGRVVVPPVRVAPFRRW